MNNERQIQRYGGWDRISGSMSHHMDLFSRAWHVRQKGNYQDESTKARSTMRQTGLFSFNATCLKIETWKKIFLTCIQTKLRQTAERLWVLCISIMWVQEQALAVFVCFRSCKVGKQLTSCSVKNAMQTVPFVRCGVSDSADTGDTEAPCSWYSSLYMLHKC